MTLPQDVIGVDIAKGWIDAFYLSASRRERISTTEQSLARFAKAAKGALVVLEASGGYERPVTEALARAGVCCCRVNPRPWPANSPAPRASWPRPTGLMRMLARMGRALELKPTPPEDPA